MKTAGPVDRYIAHMAAYAKAATRLAAQEAEFFRYTGERLATLTFFRVMHDDHVTAQRLLAYQSYLRAAKRAGRYDGGTQLRRVLPDGTTAPWVPPEDVANDRGVRLVRRLWLRRLGRPEA